jgi:hypothetical protein
MFYQSERSTCGRFNCSEYIDLMFWYPESIVRIVLMLEDLFFLCEPVLTEWSLSWTYYGSECFFRYVLVDLSK